MPFAFCCLNGVCVSCMCVFQMVLHVWPLFFWGEGLTYVSVRFVVFKWFYMFYRVVCYCVFICYYSVLYCFFNGLNTFYRFFITICVWFDWRLCVLHLCFQMVLHVLPCVCFCCCWLAHFGCWFVCVFVSNGFTCWSLLFFLKCINVIHVCFQFVLHI